MRKIMLLLFMLATASLAWAVQTDPPELDDLIFDDDAQTATIILTGNGHICLYLQEQPSGYYSPVAESDNELIWSIPYSDNPNGEQVYLGAYAQQEGMEMSKFYWFDFTLPGKRPTILGDANGDGDVNIADLTAMNYIMYWWDGNLEACDVNQDGEINISDINYFIELLLNADAPINPIIDCPDRLYIADSLLYSGNTYKLNILLDNYDQYSALQCDIIMPDGLTLVKAEAASSIYYDYYCTYRKVDDETTRAVLSNTNEERPIFDNEAVLTLTVKANANTYSSGIILTNIVASDANFKAWHLQGGFHPHLTVNFPSAIDMGDYSNMRLELLSTDGSMTNHYSVTDKSSYKFYGLEKHSSWNVALSNQYGDILGRIENVQVGVEDVTVTFDELLKPQTVKLTVVTPEGKDVTAQCKVTWQDAQGERLKQGDVIAGLPTGKQLIYTISLPRDLATACVLPVNNTYTVKDGDNTITCQLTAISQVRLMGMVKDAITNQPLYGATISATQSFGDEITKTLTASTDNQGIYSFEASFVPTKLTVAANGYINQTVECDMTGGSTVDVPDLLLSPITGAVVNVNLTYTPAHASGEAAEAQNGYSDYYNVDYEVYNKTTGQAITDKSVKYPQIVLDVADGDVLELTATSRKNAFNPVKTIVTIAEQKATATFNIVEKGKVAAKFNKNLNPEVVGILYDGDGKLVKSSEYTDSVWTIDGLADGSYKLITMGKSDLFNTVFRMNQLSKTGLVAGDDYIVSNVPVSSGIITQPVIDVVPLLDESKLYSGDNTSFTVNKSDIVVGNLLTFSTRIDFKKQYANQVSDVQVIVDLPECCPFVENSVMVDGGMGGYTHSGNQVTIPLANYANIVRFCTIPTVSGDFAPSAFVQFQLNGKTFTHPIGVAHYTAKDLSINVPSTVANTEIPVTGTSIGVCDIEVYDNGVLIGQTKSLANGTWGTTCELNKPHDLSTHQIQAKVITNQGLILNSSVESTLYDKNAIEVSKVTMYHDNPEQRKTYKVVFDYLNPSNTVQAYTYYIFNKKFSFTIDLTDNDANTVLNVLLYVKTAKSGWHTLDATYDTYQGLWVASGEFGNMYDGDLPVSVGVDFTYVVNDINVERLLYAFSNSLDNGTNNNFVIPEFDEDDYTVVQDQGQTIFSFEGLQFDGYTVNSITAGDDITVEFVNNGINKTIALSFGGVYSLPQDAYEYKLNSTQSLFVTDAADNYTTEVCFYYPVSMINDILNSPYIVQSHRYDFFNELLEKAGDAPYAYVKEHLAQDECFPMKLKDLFDDIIENCPHLDVMVEDMRYRQEHARQLNERLNRFRDAAEWISRVLNLCGPAGESAGEAVDIAGSAVELGQNIGNYYNELHDENFMAQFEAADCIPRNNPPSPPHPYTGNNVAYVIDPSGFVYEGVPSNRLEGVTATCYYKETVEDMYGDLHEEVVLWDAAQYGQENPLLTDENGYYRWDVPVGLWQVKYEKEGYETTYSDWLPVPPPQLDVNIGMVQMRQPEVIKAHAYPQAVEFEFDKFMLPETLTTDNVTVSINGIPVSGTIEVLNAEVDDPQAITSLRRAKGTGLTLASRFRFNAKKPFNANQVTLYINHGVQSYAELMMNEDYEAVLPVELEMTEIVADSVVVVPYLESKQLTVAVLPAAASAGKVINVTSTSTMFATTDAEQYTLDDNGEAVITVHGDLPGMTSLIYSIDGYDLTSATLIDVKSESDLTVATPTASIASGSEVEKGTEVYLYCKTEGATIYYTLDGSCPCDPSDARMTYNGTPIVINGAVTIKAIGVADGMYDSKIATFTYHTYVLKGDVNSDGKINIVDVVKLIDYLLTGNPVNINMTNANVFEDGVINIADVVGIIDIVLESMSASSAAVSATDILHLGT